MNRTILIVICDFLLVSLLAFSTVDINKVTDESTARQVRVDIVTNAAPDGGRDLAAVMRVALDEERKSRELLLGELAKTREMANRQQTLLSERETLLSEREQQVKNFQQELRAKEQLAAQLQRDRANLQRQYTAAETNISNLSRQLQSSSNQALISSEKLLAMENELRKQMDQAAVMKQELTQLSRSNQVVQAEKQQLTTQLRVAEVEKRHAADQVVRMEKEVEVQREEKARLAEGVKALATKSEALVEEIRDNRVLAANTIFSEYATNRVEARLSATKSGLFGGESIRNKQTATVLVSNGTDTFALCHVSDTPLSFGIPGTDWEELTGSLNHGRASVPIRSMVFAQRDPRVVLIPVTAAQARQLGVKVYRTAADPYKFQDAVLAGGSGEEYYGECKFQMDLTTPGYVRLDRNFVKGIFGKFNPSRGDLVFSRSGELLGVMVNGSYCLMIQNAGGSAAFLFGQEGRNQRTGVTLSTLYSQVMLLPQKLQ
jgi:hypothetical protein